MRRTSTLSILALEKRRNLAMQAKLIADLERAVANGKRTQVNQAMISLGKAMADGEEIEGKRWATRLNRHPPGTKKWDEAHVKSIIHFDESRKIMSNVRHVKYLAKR